MSQTLVFADRLVIPKTNMDKNDPVKTPPIEMPIWKTEPNFSTKNTRIVTMIPSTTEITFIVLLACFSVCLCKLHRICRVFEFGSRVKSLKKINKNKRMREGKKRNILKNDWKMNKSGSKVNETEKERIEWEPQNVYDLWTSRIPCKNRLNP